MNFLRKLIPSFVIFLILSLGLLVTTTKIANAACSPSISKISFQGNPDNVVYHLKITNCGAAKDYKLKVTLPDGPTTQWQSQFLTNNVNGQNVIHVVTSANFDLKITQAKNALPSKKYIPLTATVVGNSSTVATYPGGLPYIVNNDCARYQPTISGTDNNNSTPANKGDWVSYPLTLTNNNTSSCSTSYSLIDNAPSGWSVKFYKNVNGTGETTTLSNVGATTTFLVKIKSPSTATKNSTTQIKITAKDTQKYNGNTIKSDKTLSYKIGSGTTTTCTTSPDNCPSGKYCGANNTCQTGCKLNPDSCTAPLTCNATSHACENTTQDCVANPNICQSGFICDTTSHHCQSTTGSTTLNFVIGLDAIGTTGTNNVSQYATPVKTPAHTTRNMKINIFDSTNQQIYSDLPATLTYDSTVGSPTFGKFTGSANLQNDFASGNYIIKLTVPGYLTKQVPGIKQLTQGTTNDIPSLNLTTGDINGDNKIDLADYTAFANCSIFAKTQQQKADCDAHPNNRLNSNINDDLVNGSPNIDQIDYIYLLQEFSVRNGD